MPADRPTLAAWRLELRALEPVSFPVWPGVAVHAAVHRALEAHAPALTHAIHRMPISPLVISPLYHASGTLVEHAAAPGDRLWVRIVALDAATVATVSPAIDAWRERRGPLRFNWAAVTIDALVPIGLPTTPAALWEAAAPEERLTLRFTSPTVFRNKGGDRTAPEPRLVFGSYLRRWRALAGFSFPGVGQLTDAAAAEAITLADADLTPHTIVLRGAQHTAFSGTAAYTISADPPLQRAIAALAAYAAWCATGARTAYGLGQTLRVG